MSKASGGPTVGDCWLLHPRASKCGLSWSMHPCTGGSVRPPGAEWTKTRSHPDGVRDFDDAAANRGGGGDWLRPDITGDAGGLRRRRWVERHCAGWRGRPRGFARLGRKELRAVEPNLSHHQSLRGTARYEYERGPEPS